MSISARLACAILPAHICCDDATEPSRRLQLSPIAPPWPRVPAALLGAVLAIVCWCSPKHRNVRARVSLQSAQNPQRRPYFVANRCPCICFAAAINEYPLELL